jgi:hypothetical protein
MKQLSPVARRLFELSRGQDEPDAPARGRVARALSARIAAIGTATALASSGSAVAAGSFTSVAAKIVLVASVAGTVTTAGWMAARSWRQPALPDRARNQATMTTRPAAKPSLEEEPSLAPGSAPALSDPSGDPSTHRRPARRPVRGEPKSSTPADPSGVVDGLRAETDALRSAQQALREQKPRQALGLLDEQDRLFRHGVLQQERAAARVLALCQAGLVAQAHAQADRFEQLWPSSALVGRVRFACWDR